MDYSADSVIKVDPEILGGRPCFRGTRVPVRTLFDILLSGDSIAEFLDGFPSVSPEQAEAALHEAAAALDLEPISELPRYLREQQASTAA
jgi:uncharacterized protein (DUF433 family)